MTNIKRFFDDLSAATGRRGGHFDRIVLESVELMAPRASASDMRTLSGSLNGGIYTSLTKTQRADLCKVIQSKEGLIFTLRSFFHDVSWLGDIANRMKWLVKIPRNQTLPDVVRSMYVRRNRAQNKVAIQVSESEFEFIRGSEQDRIDLGWIQILLSIIRHIRIIPECHTKTTTPLTPADMTILKHIANLAIKLGFESPQISTLLEYPCLEPFRTEKFTSSRLFTEGDGVPQRHRSGPKARHYDDGNLSLFLPHVCYQDEQGEGLTYFYILRSRYLAFFGALTNDTIIKQIADIISARPSGKVTQGPPKRNGGKRADLMKSVSTVMDKTRVESAESQIKHDRINEREERRNKRDKSRQHEQCQNEEERIRKEKREKDTEELQRKEDDQEVENQPVSNEHLAEANEQLPDKQLAYEQLGEANKLAEAQKELAEEQLARGNEHLAEVNEHLGEAQKRLVEEQLSKKQLVEAIKLAEAKKQLAEEQLTEANKQLEEAQVAKKHLAEAQKRLAEDQHGNVQLGKANKLTNHQPPSRPYLPDRPETQRAQRRLLQSYHNPTTTHPPTSYPSWSEYWTEFLA